MWSADRRVDAEVICARQMPRRWSSVGAAQVPAARVRVRSRSKVDLPIGLRRWQTYSASVSPPSGSVMMTLAASCVRLLSESSLCLSLIVSPDRAMTDTRSMTGRPLPHMSINSTGSQCPPAMYFSSGVVYSNALVSVYFSRERDLFIDWRNVIWCSAHGPAKDFRVGLFC